MTDRIHDGTVQSEEAIRGDLAAHGVVGPAADAYVESCEPASFADRKRVPKGRKGGGRFMPTLAKPFPAPDTSEAGSLVSGIYDELSRRVAGDALKEQGDEVGGDVLHDPYPAVVIHGRPYSMNPLAQRALWVQPPYHADAGDLDDPRRHDWTLYLKDGGKVFAVNTDAGSRHFLANNNLARLLHRRRLEGLGRPYSTLHLSPGQADALAARARLSGRLHRGPVRPVRDRLNMSGWESHEEYLRRRDEGLLLHEALTEDEGLPHATAEAMRDEGFRQHTAPADGTPGWSEQRRFWSAPHAAALAHWRRRLADLGHTRSAYPARPDGAPAYALGAVLGQPYHTHALRQRLQQLGARRHTYTSEAGIGDTVLAFPDGASLAQARQEAEAARERYHGAMLDMGRRIRGEGAPPPSIPPGGSHG